LTHQPVVESTSNFGFGLALAVVLLAMAGTLLNAVLKDRGFGVAGNGFFLGLGLLIGVGAMRGIQAVF
jgi:hypothetical protein